jgi:hypothetical protein
VIAACAALMFVAPGTATAKSGYMRPPEPKPVTAGFSFPPELELSPSQIVGGCGSKRYRDPLTHKCRGPADFGN